MPARTGEAYIKGLQEHPREVWIDGERVQDVTTHPALRNGVRSVAALYEMQHDPALREAMTYMSPTTGHPVGLSFLMPQSVADLERRRTMMAQWAIMVRRRSRSATLWGIRNDRPTGWPVVGDV